MKGKTKDSGRSSKMMPSCKRPITLDRRYTKVPEETGKSSAKREYVFKVDCPIRNPYILR